mgnify:CR=1 FL=1
MDYGYYLQYRNLKRISNKDPRTLLFLLRFTFGFDEDTSLALTERISKGEQVKPDLIRDRRVFS